MPYPPCRSGQLYPPHALYWVVRDVFLDPTVPYRKQDLIESIHELDGNLVLTGNPEVISDLEHKVKDIGYHCETVDETTGESTIPQWSLKIFMK